MVKIGNNGLENAREEDLIIQSQIQNGEIIKIGDKFYWTDKCINWVKRCIKQLTN